MTAPPLKIDVIFALPQRCWRRTVDVPSGTTAGEALRRSGLDVICEREAGQAPTLGVFGRKVDASHILQPGERLEIYRALVADPRQRRRARANARQEQARKPKS